MRTLTKEEKDNIEIEVTEVGFTVWMKYIDEKGKKQKRWLVDGSDIKESGNISFGSSTPFQAVYLDDDNSVKLFKQ